MSWRWLINRFSFINLWANEMLLFLLINWLLLIYWLLFVNWLFILLLLFINWLFNILLNRWLLILLFNILNFFFRGTWILKRRNHLFRSLKSHWCFLYNFLWTSSDFILPLSRRSCDLLGFDSFDCCITFWESLFSLNFRSFNFYLWSFNYWGFDCWSFDFNFWSLNLWLSDNRCR